jgi:hypothetical protein
MTSHTLTPLYFALPTQTPDERQQWRRCGDKLLHLKETVDELERMGAKTAFFRRDYVLPDVFVDATQHLPVLDELEQAVLCGTEMYKCHKLDWRPANLALLRERVAALNKTRFLIVVELRRFQAAGLNFRIPGFD